MSFFYKNWVHEGVCGSFLFYSGSWVGFCVMTHFCFGLICKVDVKVQNNYVIFSYMSESHGEIIKGKLLFCFNLQGGYVGPKIVLFFSFAWVGHMDIIIEIIVFLN